MQLERVCKVYGMRFGNVHHHINALLKANFQNQAICIPRIKNVT